MAKGYQSYRGRRSVGTWIAIILLVLILVAACAFLYAQYNASYADDGRIYLELPYFGKVYLPMPVTPEPEPDEDAEPALPPVQLVVDEPETEPEPEPEPEPVVLDHHLVELSALPTDAGDLAGILAPQGANGFVYTVRDDTGAIFWASSTGQAKAVQPEAETDTEILRSLCASEDVLSVARFNVLHDSYYAFANMKDAAICQNGNYGYVWYDSRSYHWLEPEKEMARQYVVGLAVECAQLGFDELLLEELCYPTRGNTYKINYGDNTMEKKDALALLLTEIRTALEPYGTKVSLLLTQDELDGKEQDASGVDLATLLPLVDCVYTQVTDPAAAQAVLDTAVGEGAEAPMLVCMAAEPGTVENWCVPVA